MSPLGNATAMDCADYTITLFSDLTKRVTLQNLYNDGGFSNMGVSDGIMEIIENAYNKSSSLVKRNRPQQCQFCSTSLYDPWTRYAIHYPN